MRKGVFETNSSSSHSLVIRNEDIIKSWGYYDSMYFTHDEMVKSLDAIEDGEYKYYCNPDWYFGRAPFRILSSFQDKFQYAYASCRTDEDVEMVSKLFLELVPEVKKFNPPRYSGTDDYMLWTWLKNANIDLREFLTNRKYVVICDGDEYCIWNHLNKVGLIDKDMITANPGYDSEEDDFDE